MKFEIISVIGLGYIGLPTAAAFASHNIKVVGVDKNQNVVDTINQGEIHIVEPDLDIAVQSAVESGYLKAVTVPEVADAFLIAVPTPFIKENHEPDLSYIEASSKSIASILKTGDLVVLESTSPVGTTEKMVEWMSSVRPDLTFPLKHGEDSDIRVAHCPERVLPGQVMRELIENDRVIGGLTEKCSQVATELYKVCVQGNCITTTARTAEVAKLTENSFRDVNIAFANELSLICDELDINVWELIQLANRHPRVEILQPGVGVGGHCIAVDPWFIVNKTPDKAKLIRTARQVNDDKPEWILKKIQQAIDAFLQKNASKTLEDISIACYGIVFKPDIDDLRESPALEIVKRLIDIHSGFIMVVEPNINSLPVDIKTHAQLVRLETAMNEADIHILLVDHQQFHRTKSPKGCTLDFKGIW